MSEHRIVKTYFLIGYGPRTAKSLKHNRNFILSNQLKIKVQKQECL